MKKAACVAGFETKPDPQMAAPVREAGSLPHRRSGFMCVGRAEVDRAIRCVDRDTS